MLMEASLNVNLDKVALYLISKVSTPLQPPFYHHLLWPVLNVLHLRRRGDACCGYQVSSLENGNGINACVCVCVNNTPLLCVCASFADAQ